ncbi:hypothetical protein Rctr197k_159 [Virus Rctr197k]|nr:hypothetical protein Rctr197k_159 [Virus Rctr197k]
MNIEQLLACAGPLDVFVREVQHAYRTGSGGLTIFAFDSYPHAVRLGFRGHMGRWIDLVKGDASATHEPRPRARPRPQPPTPPAPAAPAAPVSEDDIMAWLNI